MGKYDIMMKCAQVRSLANEKQYRNAYEVLQTININQITSIADLNTIADVLIQLQKYDEAKDVYLKLYTRIPTRRVVYQLVYLSIKCGELEDAEEYYEEYKELDKSIDRLILRYYIDKAKGADRQTLIGYLLELKKEDYMEEWAYELAKLYHKEGMAEECIQECSDIILWFGEGLIVEKAMLLKHHYLDGADISSEKAILEETRNLAAELKIAAAIAEENERERERAEREQAEREAQMLYVRMQDMVNPEEEPDYYYEPQNTETAVYGENIPYAETPMYQEPVQYAEPEYNGDSFYTAEEMEQLKLAYTDKIEVPPYVPPVVNESYEEEPSELEREIAKIVYDIKKEKQIGHIAITGEDSDKNIEIAKYLAKELCKQQVLPTSRIARINAERLNEINLQDNQEKLLGGCLLIEDASKLSTGSIQNLYQFINRAKGNIIVILSASGERMDALLKKNRKFGNLIEYYIEL